MVEEIKINERALTIRNEYLKNLTMVKLFLTSVLALFIISMPCGTLIADAIHLKDGRRLEGEIVEDTGDYVTIRMKYGTIRVAKRDIEKIEEGKTIRQIYEEKASQIADDDADGHFDLALWCEENLLFEEQRKHLEHVILIEPDHAAAREKLGYELVDGRWVKVEKPILIPDDEPTEPEGEVLPEETKLSPPSVSEIMKKLKEGSPEEREEALLALSERPNRTAIPVLISMLEKETDETVRSVLKDTIGKFPSSSVAPHLLRVARSSNGAPALDAIEIIEALGDANACKALVVVFLERHDKVGERAELALWRKKDNAIPAISNVIRYGKRTDRLRMIELAGRMKEPRLIPAMMTYIHADRDTPYKQPGIETILGIGEPAVPYLIKFLSDAKRRAWAHHLLKLITDMDFNIDDTRDWERWWKENKERVIAEQEEWEERVRRVLDEGRIPYKSAEPLYDDFPWEIE